MSENFLADVKLSTTLATQLSQLIEAQAQRCSSRVQDVSSKERVFQNFKWVEKLATLHYKSRISRATDLESKEVAQAQELARQYIGAGNHDFFATCVDGRNMPAVMFSKPPHVGGVLRAPAGVLSGFMSGQSSNTVFIDYSTFVVRQISKLLQEKAGGTIFYGLDSHLACAARGQIHETEGGRQEDDGLRSDIISKLMIARGILQLRSELMSQGKPVAEVVPTFFSFDPHSGGVWFGLEAYVQDSAVAADGYTSSHLQKMAKDGLVISSMQLLNEVEVQEALKAEIDPGSADFRFNYAATLQKNWQAISKLYDQGQSDLFKYLLERMIAVYQKAGWLIGDMDSFDRQSISNRTLKQKTKFLLKNLVTRYSIAGATEKWPYDHHQEEMVVITDGGYAPFPATDAFAVFSHDLNGLIPNTKLTIDLIRNSRRQKKLINTFPEINFSQKDFIAASVLISNKSIIKGLTEKDWETLGAVDLNLIFSQLNWDDQAVLNWQKPNISDLILSCVNQKHIVLEMSGVLRFVNGVYELFDRMRLLLKDKHFRQMMFSGNILILNTIVDDNRFPRMILKLVV